METHTNNNDDVIKHFAVLDELDTSVKLIRLGFGELQNLNQSNDFYFLPFQLLSQGFERLMKSYICVGFFNLNQCYPELSYIKNIGHDLEKLLSKILADYFSLKGNPIVSDDKDFLTNNSDLRELLYILSEFGKYARYHNYDIITNNQKPSVNPKQLWSSFENRILFSNPKTRNKILDLEYHNEIYGELSKHILTIFENFVSALSRQLLFGSLGEKGKQFSSYVMDFAMLYPKDFGFTDYRKSTTRFKETPKRVHKRTWIDELNRKTNPRFKSKKLQRNNFQGEWPFYVDEVTIECRDKFWCIVIIDGHDYALNGSAKGRYKLENAHDAGMAIIGIGTGDIIKATLDLWK